MPTTEAPAPASALAKIITDAGLAGAKGELILSTLTPFATEARDLILASAAIEVTDATQVREIKAAREARLEIRKVRTALEHKRQELKEDSLNMGRAVDLCAGLVRKACEQEEARLQEAEDFAERAEAKRLADLKTERERILQPFGRDLSHYRLELMRVEEFDSLHRLFKREQEEQIAAAEKARLEREEAERKRIEEERAVRAENERLRAEREKQDAEIRAERERVEAERRAEREKVEQEREKQERQARREREAAEEKARKEREIVEAKARKEREAAEAKAKKEREAAAEKLRVEKAKRKALEDAAGDMHDALKAVVGHGYLECKHPASQDYVSKVAIAKVRRALAIAENI